MTRPLLFIGYGNPGRGDDGVGPELIAQLTALQQRAHLPENFDALCAIQLQIEYAWELRNRSMLIFIDADVALDRPYKVSTIKACPDASITSHAMMPQMLLHTYQLAFNGQHAPAKLVGIGGEDFGFQAGLTSTAQHNMRQALDYCITLIRPTSQN